jgi:hypothetical protein
MVGYQEVQMIFFGVLIFCLLLFFVVLPIGTICGIAKGIKDNRIRKEEAIIRKAKLDYIRTHGRSPW